MDPHQIHKVTRYNQAWIKSTFEEQSIDHERLSRNPKETLLISPGFLDTCQNHIT